MGRISWLVLPLVCVLPQATGLWLPFFSGEREASPTPQKEIVERVIKKQVGLRADSRCADTWSEFSSACPNGGIMLVEEQVITMLGSFSQCFPAGCVYADAGQAQGPARDESTVLRAAIMKEVARLEEEPGASFERQLTAMSHAYRKDGRVCKATLAALVKETSDGKRPFTTLRFFAEMARYRGFTGTEVDESWAALEKFESDEMVLAMARRASKGVAIRARGVLLAVGREAAAMTSRILQLEESLADSETKVAVASSVIKAKEAEIAGLNAEAASAKQLAAERADTLEAYLGAADIRLKKVLRRCTANLARLKSERAATSRLLSVQESLQAELAEAVAQAEARVLEKERAEEHLAAVTEKSQADAAACVTEKKESMKEFSAAMQTARTLKGSLEAMKVEGKERQGTIAELERTLQSISSKCLHRCSEARRTTQAPPIDGGSTSDPASDTSESTKVQSSSIDGKSNGSELGLTEHSDQATDAEEGESEDDSTPPRESR